MKKATVVVDFETYYSKKEKISVTELGIPNYTRAADAYMVSIVSRDLGVKFVGTIEEARQKFPDGPFWWDNQFIAANSNFDWAWAQKYWPEAANGAPWKCVLDKAAPEQCPHNLAGVVLSVCGVKMDKSIRDDMNGRQYAELEAGEQEDLRKYCLRDSELTLQAWEKLPDLTPVEEHLAEHTRRINRRGVHIDTELLERQRTLLSAVRHSAFLRIPWRNDGAPLSHQELTKYCQVEGIEVPSSIAKTSEACEEAMAAEPRLAAVIGSMRAYRRANRDITKLEAVESRLTHDNRLPLEMMYCGAPHTRRWSCRGVNIQNMDREPWELPDDLLVSPELLEASKIDGVPSIWSRHLLVPPPGKLFLALDFAQVEPRVLNWLVGNDELLETVRAGYKVYEAYAMSIGRWNGKPGQMKNDVGVALYTRTKNEVLGLGYGMGPGKYADYAGVSAVEAEQTVAEFRRRNPRIVNFWRELDGVIKRGHLNLSKALEIRTPAGGWLRYFAIRAKLGGGGYSGFVLRNDFSHASVQNSLWGGTLAENVTQRVARDVMGDAIVRLENAGHTIAFTAHDEIVLVVDRDNREDAKADAVQRMRQTPEWAPGLPLDVEGDFSERYSK